MASVAREEDFVHFWEFKDQNLDGFDNSKDLTLWKSSKCKSFFFSKRKKESWKKTQKKKKSSINLFNN